jgi:hypothetical protein
MILKLLCCRQQFDIIFLSYFLGLILSNLLCNGTACLITKGTTKRVSQWNSVLCIVLIRANRGRHWKVMQNKILMKKWRKQKWCQTCYTKNSNNIKLLEETTSYRCTSHLMLQNWYMKLICIFSAALYYVIIQYMCHFSKKLLQK